VRQAEGRVALVNPGGLGVGSSKSLWDNNDDNGTTLII
jgi:hypothetical protein